MKNRIKNVTLAILLIALMGGQVAFSVPVANAASCKSPADVEFIFREGNSVLAQDITWELYKQERNFDAGKYLGRSVRSGRLTNEGSVRFTFDPYSAPSISNRGGSNVFAVKVYDIQREQGAQIFWDVIISCGEHVKETFTLASLAVVIRDANGAPIVRQPFHIYTQTYGIDNKPIADKAVSTGLSTGDSGQKVVHLAPGEYVVKLPVPGNWGLLYQETNVIVYPEKRNIFDYRAGNVRVTITDGSGKPLENASVELYTQQYDLYGSPMLGVRQGSTRTNSNGIAALFNPAGTYAMKVTGLNNSTYYFYDIVVVSESNTVIEKRISTIRVSTRDENGVLTRGMRLALHEQLTNRDGEKVAGKALQSVVSDDIGEAVFYAAPGVYALKANNETIYSIEVKEGETAMVTYRKQKTVVKTGSGSPVVVKGITFTAFPSGSLVKTPNDTAVYFIEKGQLRRIPDAETFNALNFKWNAIHMISQDEFDAYPKGLPLQQVHGVILSEGTIAKSDQSPAIYLITNGTKRAFHDAYSFETLGYDWKSVVTVSTFVLDQYASGDEIKVPVSAKTNLVKSSDSSVVYRIENGFKRPFETEAAFFAEGHAWDEVRIVPFSEIRAYPLGAAIR